MKKKVRIIVAAHKEFQMPEDKIYLPVHVGAAGKESIGYQRDDEGDNISDLNPLYCELTGLYWAWKNLDADYKGLVHYRRYFKGKGKGNSPFDKVLSGKELRFLLRKYKIIVPRKRRYYIETLYSHYEHTHYEEEMIETRKIISEIYPEYLSSYDKTMNRTWGYMFNMMIMSSELLDEYCTWLFNILDELVLRVDVESRSDFEKRYPGRISEMIFNTWLDYKISKNEISQDDIAELPFIYMEKINYFDKGMSFLKAKFFNKKQEKSF